MKRLSIVISAIAIASGSSSASESVIKLPASIYDPIITSPGFQKLILAGGCFWGIQSVFQHVKGVEKAVSGYTGGEKTKARYDLVSNGNTGHAESVEVTYDPRIVSTGELLRIFFSVAHNPTELDRQGPDEGTQYRSEIFTTSETQNKVAIEYISQLNRLSPFKQRIVTRIENNKSFYRAEAYHQDYAYMNPEKPYIINNDRPKVENLKNTFPELYREDPVLTITARQGL